MAIYRPPKPRWRLALVSALGGLLVGLLAGLILGSDEPDPTTAAHEIRSTLAAAAGSLEVAAIEYEESVADGAVVREPEYEGALGALESSRQRFSEVRAALVSLFPDQVEPIEDLYDAIERGMTAHVDAAEISADVDRLIALLEGRT